MIKLILNEDAKYMTILKFIKNPDALV